MASRERRVDRLMKAFGRRLRAARITSGYEEAADFAEELGISSPRYRKYERGESMPPLDVLEDIARITERSLDWILSGQMSERARKGSRAPQDPSST